MLGAYEIEATVGEGAYGWVFTGHKRGNNMRVAIKKFKVRPRTNEMISSG